VAGRWDKAWLWVATNANLSVYWVTKGRSFDDATQMTDDDYDGIIVGDGWIVYDRYSAATHQTCLAHLARRCREMEADLTGADR
jgi:transposase